MDPSDVAMAREWAAFYRLRGLNPLPGRPDAKRPLCRFADWWESPAPADLFDRFPTTNVQVMTGRAWRLLAIDLDGAAARAEWPRFGRCPTTWVTHSGGGGVHLWFRLPDGLAAAMPKAVLWRGAGAHSAVERLCDRSLIVAPPSIHPATGRRYRFLDRAHSPARLPMPADCPRWILAIPPLASPAAPPAAAQAPAMRRPARPVAGGGRLDVGRILDAVADKVAVARSWGVRVAGRPSPTGWVPVHAIDRDDVHPSAAIHHRTGRYVDLGSGLRLSFFDVAVRLGIYRDWREAAADLGDRYGYP